MSERALRTIERLEHRRPDAVRLAMLASLAVRVDAHLLRRLRTTLAPDADVGAEADLWFSPLVESRGVHGFVLAHDAGRLLREMLAADEALLERAHRVTAAAHAGAPATIRIEEEVNALSLRGGDDVLARIDAALRPAVLAMVRDETSGLDIARWAARALPRFHPRVHETESAALLAIGAAARLGSHIEKAEGTSALRPTTDVRWVLPASARSQQTVIGVELLADGVRFVEQGRGQPLRLPRTSPLLVHLFWQEDGTERRRTVEAAVGRTERFGTAVEEVGLRTIAGDDFLLSAVPLRTGIDTGLVAIELLGSNGPAATGFIAAPNRIVTAAEPFRGVPILAVKHATMTFQARVIYPAEGVEAMRPELEGSVFESDVMVLEPIDAPPLRPVLPVEWRLSGTSPTEQDTPTVDETAEIRWIDEGGNALVAEGDVGVYHYGGSILTLTVGGSQPPLPPPAPGAAVIARDMVIGIVTRVESDGILEKGLESPTETLSQGFGDGYRVRAIGSVLIAKVLEAVAARERFAIARVPVLDLRRGSGGLLPSSMGLAHGTLDVLEVRAPSEAPDLTADIHLQATADGRPGQLFFDLEEASALLVVIDPREDPDASGVRKTLRRARAGAPEGALPALVVSLDSSFPEFGNLIGESATEFIAIHPDDPYVRRKLEQALVRLIPWVHQAGESRASFEKVRDLLARIVRREYPPVLPLPEFVKEAGDIHAAHTARIVGGRILESGGREGVAVLDPPLFYAVIDVIMDTRAPGFNDPLPVLDFEEMRRRVYEVLQELSVAGELHEPLYEGTLAELERIGEIAVVRGIDAPWVVYPRQFEPRGPIATGPETAEVILTARAPTAAIREMLLLALDLHASENFEVLSAYWRTPPRSGIELRERSGAPLFIEHEPDDVYSIVVRRAYGEDPKANAGFVAGLADRLRELRRDWLTIEPADSARDAIDRSAAREQDDRTEHGVA